MRPRDDKGLRTFLAIRIDFRSVDRAYLHRRSSRFRLASRFIPGGDCIDKLLILPCVMTPGYGKRLPVGLGCKGSRTNVGDPYLNRFAAPLRGAPRDASVLDPIYLSQPSPFPVHVTRCALAMPHATRGGGGGSSGYRVLEVFRYVPIEQPLLFCVVAMPVDARNFQ
jgi:hypothetical protein